MFSVAYYEKLGKYTRIQMMSISNDVVSDVVIE
jgi:hypothetical protein